jgi:hypothetical protein
MRIFHGFPEFGGAVVINAFITNELRIQMFNTLKPAPDWAFGGFKFHPA